MQNIDIASMMVESIPRNYFVHFDLLLGAAPPRNDLNVHQSDATTPVDTSLPSDQHSNRDADAKDRHELRAHPLLYHSTSDVNLILLFLQQHDDYLPKLVIFDYWVFV